MLEDSINLTDGNHLRFTALVEAGYFTLFAKGFILKSRRGIPIFLTNNMIFLECGVIALIEAFYMFRDHNHVKSFDMLNYFISSCSAQVTISQELAK